MRRWIWIGWVLMISRLACADLDYVWWEGEAATAHNFSNTAFGDWLQKRDGLSGGKWLNTGGKRGADEIFARYDITLPANATYYFWARKFWKHGPFRWRFDNGEWHECGRDIGLADSFEFQTHICANWVALGDVPLTAGKHVFELRLLAREGEDAAACFDCFLLTPHAFQPRGKLKPGEKSGSAEPEYWAFEPDTDRFDRNALLDLRSLNEREAGQAGFVRVAGEHFVLATGQPVRFWAVNIGPGILELGHDQLDYLAARLAKTGVNMVRIHGAVFERENPARVNPAYLERLFYCIAALKEQGIYSALSFYFPLWLEPHPFGQIFFDPELQANYRTWVRALLTTKNPYTGRPLAQEPAVGLLELVNEDSLFFWTFSPKNIPPVKWAALEQKFGGKLFDAWNMTPAGLANASVAHREAIARQIQFLAETQRAFYAATKKFLREELGAKSLIVASNWKTADDVTLGPKERWTYMVGDVLDRHVYFGGQHTGPRAGYAVSVGDTFQDRAAVRERAKMPLAEAHVPGYPNIISELGWTMPNRYRADNTFLTSAVGAQQKLAGVFFFAVNNASWSATAEKFPVSVPSVLGQFPAAALQYRRGDLTSAKDELTWNETTGFVTIKSPRSVGACGFLDKAGPVQLGEVTIDCRNEYAAIHVISLDGAPLTTARKILVQAFTEEHPYGWKVDVAGKILDLGQPPLNVRNVAATVSFLTGIHRATVLDCNGNALHPATVSGNAVTLPPDALYTIVER